MANWQLQHEVTPTEDLDKAFKAAREEWAGQHPDQNETEEIAAQVDGAIAAAKALVAVVRKGDEGLRFELRGHAVRDFRNSQDFGDNLIQVQVRQI